MTRAIVFDLDGTLLNGSSEVSPHTRETLRLLRERGVAYTVATGRTLHASTDLLTGQGFELPHIYKNGVFVITRMNVLLKLDRCVHTILNVIL